MPVCSCALPAYHSALWLGSICRTWLGELSWVAERWGSIYSCLCSCTLRAGTVPLRVVPSIIVRIFLGLVNWPCSVPTTCVLNGEVFQPVVLMSGGRWFVEVAVMQSPAAHVESCSTILAQAVRMVAAAA